MLATTLRYFFKLSIRPVKLMTIIFLALLSRSTSLASSTSVGCLGGTGAAIGSSSSIRLRLGTESGNSFGGRAMRSSNSAKNAARSACP